MDYREVILEATVRALDQSNKLGGEADEMVVVRVLSLLYCALPDDLRANTAAALEQWESEFGQKYPGGIIR